VETEGIEPSSKHSRVAYQTKNTSKISTESQISTCIVKKRRNKNPPIPRNNKINPYPHSNYTDNKYTQLDKYPITVETPNKYPPPTGGPKQKEPQQEEPITEKPKNKPPHTE
jgi:hypothetical protein